MAKKITEESLRLNIVVNGDQGRKANLDLKSAVGSNSAKPKKLKEATGAERTLPMRRFSRGMPSRRLRQVSQFSVPHRRSPEPTCTPG